MGIQIEGAKKVHVNTASQGKKIIWKKVFRTNICG